MGTEKCWVEGVGAVCLRTSREDDEHASVFQDSDAENVCEGEGLNLTTPDIPEIGVSEFELVQYLEFEWVSNVSEGQGMNPVAFFTARGREVLNVNGQGWTLRRLLLERAPGHCAADCQSSIRESPNGWFGLYWVGCRRHGGPRDG